MAESKQKTLHYRFVEGLHDGRTLQEILTPLLYETHSLVRERSEAVTHDDPEERIRRCITERRSYGDMLFGMLIAYVAGNDKQAVMIDEEQEDLPLGQVNLPKVDGKSQEFIDGAVYFGLLGNHMVLMQSQSLQDRHLENHLGWLLLTKADALESDERLGLRRQLTLSQDEISDVTGVQVGSGLVTREQESAEEETGAPNNATSTSGTTSIQVTDIGRGILEQLLGTEWQQLVDTDDYHDLDSLEVTINVRKVGGPRKEGNDPERLMGALTTQLRHTYAEDLTVFTKQGPISGDKLFLSERQGVECHNGVPLTDNAYIKMRDWLQAKLEQGVIAPE